MTDESARADERPPTTSPKGPRETRHPRRDEPHNMDSGTQDVIDQLSTAHWLTPGALEVIAAVWGDVPWFLPGGSPLRFVPCEPWTVYQLAAACPNFEPFRDTPLLAKYDIIKLYEDPIKKGWCGYVPGNASPLQVQGAYNTMHPQADTTWRLCWPRGGFLGRLRHNR